MEATTSSSKANILKDVSKQIFLHLKTINFVSNTFSLLIKKTIHSKEIS